MGLSQLSERCRKCPFVDKCDHKRMEALAYLPEPQIAMNASQSAGIDAAQPLLRGRAGSRKVPPDDYGVPGYYCSALLVEGVRYL